MSWFGFGSDSNSPAAESAPASAPSAMPESVPIHTPPTESEIIPASVSARSSEESKCPMKANTPSWLSYLCPYQGKSGSTNINASEFSNVNANVSEISESTNTSASDGAASRCPIDHGQSGQTQSCPVNHSKSDTNAVNPFTTVDGTNRASETSLSTVAEERANRLKKSWLSSADGSKCPMHKDNKAAENEDEMMSHGYGEINPRNMMPEVVNNPLSSDNVAFSKERESSTIPKTGEDKNSSTSTWTYPSPQQFYNAIRRRGKVDEADRLEQKGVMDSVVFAHNVTNERTWREILDWEKMHYERCPDPSLLSFVGKSEDPSLRARLSHALQGTSVFDRHDWTVDRCGIERVRYIIDYYDDPHATEDEYGLQISLVTRPAMFDSVGNMWDFIRRPYYKWQKNQGDAMSKSDSLSTEVKN